MQSVMSHDFSRVPKAEIPRSSFDRSHGFKTTFDAGWIVPFFIDEALPGDTFNLNATMFARLATPIKPFMDNLFLDTHFFAVPIRLVWDNWQKFCGEQRNPADSTSYVIPQMVSPAGGYAVGTLSDFFGIPTGIAGLSHSSLWHRAYNLIWNEWYRDQNLQNSVTVDVGDGPDTPANYVIKRRNKRPDYFSSGLPWPQKGQAVTIPLGSTAPVELVSTFTQIPVIRRASDHVLAAGEGNLTAAAANARLRTSTTPYDAVFDPAGSLFVNLNNATAATINSLRQAFQVQRLYERDARGGTRYTEIVRSHFGVVSPDARLQRPEYLGGGSSMVNVNPIAQTSSTDTTTPQGNLSAMGTVTVHGHGFTKSFTEHCLLLGVLSVRADLTYQQGLNRMFSRSTRWDFYWPALSHIGEQAILNKEIYAQGTAGGAADAGVFAYQERFAEYRYKPSLITGQFRSTYAQSLDFWHLSQEFSALPVLNDSFIQENPPVARVIAVTTEPHFLLDAYIKLKCARPMPVYGVPGMIDHF